MSHPRSATTAAAGSPHRAAHALLRSAKEDSRHHHEQQEERDSEQATMVAVSVDHEDRPSPDVNDGFLVTSPAKELQALERVKELAVRRAGLVFNGRRRFNSTEEGEEDSNQRDAEASEESRSPSEQLPSVSAAVPLCLRCCAVMGGGDDDDDEDGVEAGDGRSSSYRRRATVGDPLGHKSLLVATSAAPKKKTTTATTDGGAAATITVGIDDGDATIPKWQRETAHHVPFTNMMDFSIVEGQWRTRVAVAEKLARWRRIAPAARAGVERHEAETRETVEVDEQETWAKLTQEAEHASGDAALEEQLWRSRLPCARALAYVQQIGEPGERQALATAEDREFGRLLGVWTHGADTAALAERTAAADRAASNGARGVCLNGRYVQLKNRHRELHTSSSDVGPYRRAAERMVLEGYFRKRHGGAQYARRYRPQRMVQRLEVLALGVEYQQNGYAAMLWKRRYRRHMAEAEAAGRAAVASTEAAEWRGLWERAHDGQLSASTSQNPEEQEMSEGEAEKKLGATAARAAAAAVARGVEQQTTTTSTA